MRKPRTILSPLDPLVMSCNTRSARLKSESPSGVVPHDVNVGSMYVVGEYVVRTNVGFVVVGVGVGVGEGGVGVESRLVAMLLTKLVAPALLNASLMAMMALRLIEMPLRCRCRCRCR